MLSVHFIFNLIRGAVLQCRTTSPKAWWEQLTFFEQIVQKNAWGSTLTDWMQGFFFDQSLSNLQRYVEDPSSFLVLWSSPLFFFSSVFSPLLFFPFFLLLIPFWRWYLCHFCFLLSTFTWWYFSEKVCDVALSSYWLSFVWFYTNESFRDKRRKWFSCQSFSKSVSVVHDHNIDTVFSIFLPEEKLLHLSHFVWQRVFFDSG